MTSAVFQNALDLVIRVLQSRSQSGTGGRVSSHKLGDLLSRCALSATDGSSPNVEILQVRPESAVGVASGALRAETGPVVLEPEARIPSVKLLEVDTEQTVSPLGVRRLPPLPPESGRTAAETLGLVKAGALVCRNCPELVACRSQVVFDEGSVGAQLLLLSEAPGEDEDREGRPFAGEADDILQKMLQAMGLSRSSAYFTSVVKCRPELPGEPDASRPPSAQEVENCLPYLAAQIASVRPRVIVAFGAGAMHALFGGKEPMGKMRSHWRELYGIPLMPTFHPSYLIRNRALSERRKVWEDLLQVMERLELPVSDRQRAFFLPQTR